MGRKLFWLINIFAICITLACNPGAYSASEYQVKAAFLYNFISFTEWPAKAFREPSDPIVIGVLGEDPFGNTLDQAVEGKTVNGRKLVVKRFKKAKDIDVCHTLLISSSEKDRLRSILDDLKGSSILTIGDMDGFARRGGIIGFTMEDKKVSFEINVKAAKKAELKISSKLLRLAKIVGGKP